MQQPNQRNLHRSSLFLANRKLDQWEGFAVKLESLHKQIAAVPRR